MVWNSSDSLSIFSTSNHLKNKEISKKSEKEENQDNMEDSLRSMRLVGCPRISILGVNFKTRIHL